MCFQDVGERKSMHMCKYVYIYVYFKVLRCIRVVIPPLILQAVPLLQSEVLSHHNCRKRSSLGPLASGRRARPLLEEKIPRPKPKAKKRNREGEFLEHDNPIAAFGRGRKAAVHSCSSLEARTSNVSSALCSNANGTLDGTASEVWAHSRHS